MLAAQSLPPSALPNAPELSPQSGAAQVSSPTKPSSALSAKELRIVAAIAEATIPAGRVFEGGGFSTAQRLQQLLCQLPSGYIAAYRAVLWAAELSTLPVYRRSLSMLSVEQRAKHLEHWSYAPSNTLSHLARALQLPLRLAHYNTPAFHELVQCHFERPRPRAIPQDRWQTQVLSGQTLDGDLHLECEVVVVGTGAGGAPCAYELAARGRAVVLLEEGRFYDRRHFTGRVDQAFVSMYRDAGLTFALGNLNMPVWAGRAVGGSTVVNSGTCYRTPERVFARWRKAYGLQDFSSSTMAPYYQRVETMLGVAEAEQRYLGGIARVVARGASKLHLHHGPLQRNAPGCDGAGSCCFGCPSGAKRSTDVSYVPEAIKRGAQLVTSARVDTIEVRDGQARAVSGVLESGRRFRVEAQAVVIAGGALMTPVLLRKNHLCMQSGWLGKNLSVHPASKVMAVFDETIDMASAIPQGYAVDDYQPEGIMLEGGSVPPAVAAMGIWYVGRPMVELMDQYRHLALFGFMIQDHSRGQVRPGPGGSPLILYNLSAQDTRRMQRAIEILCEIFLEAGAKRVLPFVRDQYELRSRADLQRLRLRELHAGDFEVTAYHPLGTCRIGTDPHRSCVGPDHQAHDVRRLFVVDGSAVPSSLGVNPQLTIMAMALRAGELIDQQLD